jgi:hypothetical protein
MKKRLPAALALLLIIALNALMVAHRYHLFTHLGRLGFWSLFDKHFEVSGFDPYTYLTLSQWDVYYEVYRHPLLALLLWPLAQLNEWLMGALHINCAIFIVAALLTVCSWFSFIFLRRILRHGVGLQPADATLLSFFYFSFAYVMLSAMAPDHFGLSMMLLLLTLWLAARSLNRQRPMPLWQTTLLYILTAGVTLSNGAKVVLAAAYSWWLSFRGYEGAGVRGHENCKSTTEGKVNSIERNDEKIVNSKSVNSKSQDISRTPAPPYPRTHDNNSIERQDISRPPVPPYPRTHEIIKLYIITLLLATVILAAAAIWQDRAFVQPRAERGQRIEQQKLMKDSTLQARRDKREARNRQIEGRPIADSDNHFLRWTNVSIPRMRSAVENFMGESLQLHSDHLLADIYTTRPVFVGYRSPLPYAVEAIITLLLLAGIWCSRRQPLMQLCLLWFAIDLTLHFILGFGLNEVYIMTAHWAFIIPIATGYLLKAEGATATLPTINGKTTTMLRMLILLLTIYLYARNLPLIIHFMLHQ